MPAVLQAPDSWKSLAFISDLHLQAQEPATAAAWLDWLGRVQADAVFILGDLFEVWVGDDAALAPGFEADCAAALRATSTRRPIHFMHGNRDFLLGPTFAELSGLTLLDDPTVLVFGGQRWLLSHGDALCLADSEYQAFRTQVRAPAWQRDFLAQSLALRRQMARTMRDASEQRKSSLSPADWADLDADATRAWLASAQSQTLIHGHTHRPAEHDLGDGLSRVVLSDWDATAAPPRLQELRLTAAGLQRLDLR